MNQNKEIEIRFLSDCKQFILELAQLWINELGKDSEQPFDIKNVVQRFVEHCNKDKLPLTYVAIYQNKPIGMASLRVTEGAHHNLTPWLGGLVVHPDYRRKKVGEKLVSAVKNHAKLLGYSEIYLLSYDELLAWYEKLGWQSISATDNEPDITILTIRL